MIIFNYKRSKYNKNKLYKKMKFFQYCKSSYKQGLQLSDKLEIFICIFLSIHAVIRKIVHNDLSKKFLYSV